MNARTQMLVRHAALLERVTELERALEDIILGVVEREWNYGDVTRRAKQALHTLDAEGE